MANQVRWSVVQRRLVFHFFCSVIDTLKGSYYANPIVDKPSVSRSEQEKYPEYYGQNICKDFPVMLVYIHEVTNASKRARER